MKEFLEESFAYAGLDWKEYVKIDPKYFRPTEVENLVADASKAKKLLGWEPKVTFKDLVRIMVDADLEDAGLPTPARAAESSPPRVSPSSRNSKGWARSRKEDPGHRRVGVPRGSRRRAIARTAARGGRTSPSPGRRGTTSPPGGVRGGRPGQDLVIHLAGNAGGIGWNRSHPGALFFDNAAMGSTC